MSSESILLQLQTTMRERAGCPVCALAAQAGHHYLDGLLWEAVNDSGVRTRLLASMGLCARHSRQLLSFPGERLGVAILEQAVLRHALRELDEPLAGSGPSLLSLLGRKITARAGAGPAAACPACQHEEDHAQRLLAALSKHFDQGLGQQLAAAGGLCRPHLRQALTQTSLDQPTRQALLDLHRTLWQQTVEHLGEYIRKKDHRFRHESESEAERQACERAIAILTGEQEAP